jgi:hypothetical protein
MVAINRRNVWAVGTDDDQPRALALHWRGTLWKRISAPTTQAQWSSAVFTTPIDGWAVGGSEGPGVAIARWDGRRWTAVAVPDLGDRRASLDDVAALGNDDVWAVGSVSIGPAHAGVLVEHWNGTRWTVVPTPDVGQSQLLAVAAISRNNVWAVGNQIDNSLIEHWDGKRWEVIPNPAAPLGRLTDIAAVSARDIWAVGDHGPPWPARQRPLIEHWDGTKWRVVSSPVRGVGLFHSVDVVSHGDVWVSGGVGGDRDLQDRAILVRRKGTNWRTVEPPRIKGQRSLQIVAAGKNDIWGIAQVANFSDTRPRIVHYRCFP